jgi:peroxiredoxin
VKVYNTYKDKGLAIVGISLDQQKESWKKAIDNDQLDWTNVSHLKRWDDPIAAIYGVRSIPQLFLLDENGVVIAKERHAADFIPFLEKILL